MLDISDQLRRIRITWKLLVRNNIKQFKRIKQISWWSDAAIFVLILGSVFSFYKSHQVTKFKVETTKVYNKTQNEEVKPYLVDSSVKNNNKSVADMNLKSDSAQNSKTITTAVLTSELDRVNSLFDCMDSQDCEAYTSDYDNTDNYNSRVGKQIKNELYRLFESDKVSQAKLEDFIKARIIGADDYVKEAGIHILSLAPKSDQNLNLILKSLGESQSGPLFIQGMEVIKPYLSDSEQSKKIDTMLISKLKEKNLSTSQEIAQNIFVFLSDENIDKYESVLSDMSKTSKQHRALSSNVKEFNRMQNGG